MRNGINPKIYVLNLQRSNDRREFMIDQLNKFKVDFELFQAIDGRLLKDEYIQEHAIVQELNRINISKGHLACALSHLFIYKRISERNDKHILILEDDIRLSDKFIEIIREAFEHLKDGEIIFPYFIPKPNCRVKSRDQVDLMHQYSLREIIDPGRALATGAYLLTKNTAKNLFKGAYPVRNQPDNWGFYYKEGLISQTRMIYPMIAESAHFSSDIGYLEKYEMVNNIIRFMQSKTNLLEPFFRFRRKRIAKKLRNQIIIDD